MAFNVDVTVAKLVYPVNNPPVTELIANKVLAAGNMALRQLGLKIAKSLTMKEYNQANATRLQPRYIRVSKKVQDKIVNEIISVGNEYKFGEQFLNSRYGTVSISAMGENTVIWFNFNKKLLMMAGESFNRFYRDFSVRISNELRCETIYMHATSASRNEDSFIVSIGGKERNGFAGKAALTEVKNTYDIDINEVMSNVDENLTIFYAPFDRAFFLEEVAKEKNRIANMDKLLDETKDSQLGTKTSGMNENIKADNNLQISTLNERLNLLDAAMRRPIIGDVKFFMLDQIPRPKEEDLSEREFGRNVERPKPHS